MHYRLSVTEMARNFAEYINRVAYRGDRITLMRGRRAVAELRPVPAGRTLSELPALLASLPRLSPEEAEDFARDVEAAREEANRAELRDPWASCPTPAC